MPDNTNLDNEPTAMRPVPDGQCIIASLGDYRVTADPLFRFAVRSGAHTLCGLVRLDREGYTVIAPRGMSLADALRLAATLHTNDNLCDTISDGLERIGTAVRDGLHNLWAQRSRSA